MKRFPSYLPIAFLAAVASVWAFVADPAQAQQTAKVLSSCGSATYTAGTVNYETVDTTGASCGTSSGGGGSTTANQGTPNAGGSQAWPVIMGPATTIATATLASNLVVDAAPGKLFSFDISADATLSAAAWWVMVFNATTLPADGTVTPAKCYAAPAGATSLSGAFTAPPAFTTGIVLGVSTTGCFTKTASVHAFLSADYQ